MTADTYAAPARLAPAPVTEYIAQAHVAPNYQQFGTVLVNPQSSTFAVEASASQIVGSFTTVNESVPGSFERKQQRTVENNVHVPVSRIQDQFVEGVKEIHQERLPERTEELIEDTPAPQGQLIAEETTVNTSSTSTSSTSPGVSSATQVPALE